MLPAEQRNSLPRTAYLGNNSRVSSLIGKVVPGSVGNYTLELQTARPPLGLTVNIGRLGTPFAMTDSSENATVLLGLIGNVDEVTFTATSISGTAEFDVKKLGQDQNVLAGYLSKMHD